jgi:hypothetical protein
MHIWDFTQFELLLNFRICDSCTSDANGHLCCRTNDRFRLGLPAGTPRLSLVKFVLRFPSKRSVLSNYTSTTKKKGALIFSVGPESKRL